MTASRIVHEDDGGKVSLFGQGKQMLFACDKGHWWIVEAESAGSNEDADAGSDGVAVAALRESFGDRPIQQMRLDR